MLNLLWLQAGGCGGCTLSLLGADARDLFAQLKDVGINVVFHPALSEASGPEALEILHAAADGQLPVDILCIEGAVLRGPNGSGRFHVLAGTGQPMLDWVRRLAERARHVFAIGSCTAFGGVPAAGDNATDACGLQFEGQEKGGILGADWQSPAGLPVVNVAGCPTHPGWVLDSLMALALGQLQAKDLDALQRPRFYSDQLVHHGCPRNEFYEFKASAHQPSELGCLMENLGCKGTQAHADCNTRLPLWQLVRASTAAPTYFPPETIAKLKRAYRYLLVSKLNATMGVSRMRAEQWLVCPEVQYLTEFIRGSNRGVLLRRPTHRTDEAEVDD